MNLASPNEEVVSLYKRGIRNFVCGYTALLRDLLRTRHQSLFGERLKVCLALPVVDGTDASGDVSEHVRDEARRRVLANVHVIGDRFGDLSIHEFAAVPGENLAYSAYYSGGLRVFSFGESGLKEEGAFIDECGNNFWDIEYTRVNGVDYAGASDRDFGVYVFRYKGKHPR